MASSRSVSKGAIASASIGCGDNVPNDTRDELAHAATIASSFAGRYADLASTLEALPPECP